ncbi:MAG: hypothetical protein HOM55_05520 [Proteobacteria bacterium]|nr:hypothetical protein [Pseudomonadota bacterium]
MSWEELALSFRLRLTCRPNLHDQLVEMFLIAGPNNIGKILMDFESQHHADDKIIISCGGNKYKIDKYCPHQGTNLEYGWEDSGFAPSIAGDLTLMMAIAKMQIYESLRNESISQLESIRL